MYTWNTSVCVQMVKMAVFYSRVTASVSVTNSYLGTNRHCLMISLLLRIERMLDFYLGDASKAVKTSADRLEEKGDYKPFESLPVALNKCKRCEKNLNAPLYTCPGTMNGCKNYSNICNYCLYQHIKNDGVPRPYAAGLQGTDCTCCGLANTTTYETTAGRQCTHCLILTTEGNKLHQY